MLNIHFLPFRFSAERFSKPVEELKPPSEHKRAGARKPMMSVIAGMPYKKVYKPTGELIKIVCLLLVTGVINGGKRSVLRVFAESNLLSL